KPFYDVRLLSESGGPVRTSIGITIETKAFDAPDFETVIFGAATQIQESSAGMLAFVRKALSASRRVSAPCAGAFVLAEAGILDGRRATTHWLFARQIQAAFPEMKVHEHRVFLVV